MKYKAIILSLFLCAAMQAQTPCDGLKIANNDIKLSNVSVQDNGQNMLLSLDLNLDSLRMPTNTRIVYTPWVKTANDSVKMPQIVINGRRQQIMHQRGVDDKVYDDRAFVVRRYNGTPQTVNYSGTVPYEKWMRNATIDLHEDLCGCGDSLDGRDIPIYEKFQPVMAYVRPEAHGPKTYTLDKTSYIDFPVDKITLYPDYRRNPIELDSIINTINITKNDTNIIINEINIHGFASPESPYSHNDYLAQNRAKTLKDYVCRLVKLPNSLFTVSHTPENWEGLIAYVKESNLEHKAEILALCQDESIEPDAREWKIKTTYPDEYKFMLATWYPALRRSDYHIKYTVKPFSVEQAKKIIKTKPYQLSVQEMFWVANTYEPGSDEFNDVMLTAVRLYPNDETANLNAAIACLNNEDTKSAAVYLKKAGNSADAIHARGILAALDGHKTEAKELLQQAVKAGATGAQENLNKLK